MSPLAAGAISRLGPDTATEQPRQATPIDKWISEPTPLVVSRGQRAQLDSLRMQYLREQPDSRSTDRMSHVIQMAGLEKKYLELVRAVLSAEQQKVFDGNVKAAGIRR